MVVVAADRDAGTAGGKAPAAAAGTAVGKVQLMRRQERPSTPPLSQSLELLLTLLVLHKVPLADISPVGRTAGGQTCLKCAWLVQVE